MKCGVISVFFLVGFSSHMNNHDILCINGWLPLGHFTTISDHFVIAWLCASNQEASQKLGMILCHSYLGHQNYIY